MSIKSLLNQGGVSRGTLEKVADAILIAPRAMWLGKSVKMNKNSDGKYELQHNPESRCLHSKLWQPFKDEGPGGEGVMALAIAFAIFEFFASAVLVIPLGVGLALKKIAVSRDEKSKNFQKVADNRLNLDDQIFEHDHLEEHKKGIDQKIWKLQKNIEVLPDNNPLVENQKQRAKRELEILKGYARKTTSKLKVVDQKIEKIKKVSNDLGKLIIQ